MHSFSPVGFLFFKKAGSSTAWWPDHLKTLLGTCVQNKSFLFCLHAGLCLFFFFLYRTPFECQHRRKPHEVTLFLTSSVQHNRPDRSSDSTRARCCLQVDQLTTGEFSLQTLRGFLSACPRTEDSSATSCLRRTLEVKESDGDGGGHGKWGSAQLPSLNWCHPAIVGVLTRSNRKKTCGTAEQLEKETTVAWRRGTFLNLGPQSLILYCVHPDVNQYLK